MLRDFTSSIAFVLHPWLFNFFIAQFIFPVGSIHLKATKMMTYRRPQSIMLPCILSLVSCVVESLEIFQPQSVISSKQNENSHSTVWKMPSNHDDTNLVENYNSNRRSFFKKSGTYLAGVSTSFYMEEANADDLAPKQPTSSGDFDCLLDLPPVTPNCARLYLCRHGQTENNRLHLVQGARVDPPINDNGYEQARRLGMTISHLSSGSDDGRIAIPNTVAHSKMRRARDTAETLTFVANESWNAAIPKPKLLGEVPALGEVDFGDLEGTDSQKAKIQMMRTFASWSIGDIDKRLAGGESGREVLLRAIRALELLSEAAVSFSASGSPSILAVSHSTYLRVLLSLVHDSPLAQSAFMKINNGSINVIDVNIKGKTCVVNLHSGLFGGGRGLDQILKGNSEVNFVMPEAHLIRQNEVRHLYGLEV